MNTKSEFRYYILCLISGCVWAAIGYALAEKAMGKLVWGGVVASPLIGIAVGAIFRPACRFSRFSRVLLSLATLYVAVGMFGLAVGIYDAFRDMPPGTHRMNWAVITQSVLACWWGLMLSLYGGLLIGLWLLSFLNHSLVCHFGQRSQIRQP